MTAEEIANAKYDVMAAFDIYRGVPVKNTIYDSQSRIFKAANANGCLTFYPNSVINPIVF